MSTPRYGKTMQLVGSLDFQELIYQPLRKITPRSAHAGKLAKLPAKALLSQA